jgi:hypothetical protein
MASILYRYIILNFALHEVVRFVARRAWSARRMCSAKTSGCLLRMGSAFWAYALLASGLTLVAGCSASFLPSTRQQ